MAADGAPLRRASRAGRSAGGKAFDLVTEWRLGAPVDLVWSLLRAVEAWPAWWPRVAAVETLEPGDGEGVGARHRLLWTTALPYRLAIETQVIAVEPMRRIVAAASGELDGTGIWTLEPVPGGCLVRYRWRVRPNKPWMRRFAPWLAPVFAWNHDRVMESGRKGAEARLRALAELGEGA